MSQGAALWEGATSKVNFIYVPAQDASCTTRNNSVLFSVEPTSTTQYIARAFFPSTSKRSRNILVDASSLMNSGSWTPGNILGHELGHTLGFRHEHCSQKAAKEAKRLPVITPPQSISRPSWRRDSLIEAAHSSKATLSAWRASSTTPSPNAFRCGSSVEPATARL